MSWPAQTELPAAQLEHLRPGSLRNCKRRCKTFMDEGPKYGRGIHAYMAHSSLLPNPDRARIIFSLL
jgi:hypothetical protein